MMTHTEVIITIIILGGLLGGLTNFLLLYDLQYNKKECWISFFKSILLGLCASITVPLFLQIIQTNLLEVQKDIPFPDKNYLVLFGFCVVAAIYSKQFLRNIHSKIAALDSKVAKVQQEAEEAKHKATENERDIKNTKAEFFNNEEANAIKENVQNNASNIIQSDNVTRGCIDAQHTMLAVATGTTFQDNLRYNIYYDPALRTHATDFKFIGLYKSWAIRAVGEVKKIVYCDYDEEKNILIPKGNEEVFRNLAQTEIKRIKDVITNTKYYDLETGHKFFLIDQFYETEYLLDSPIMGKQYFWLNEISGFKPDMSAKDLSKLLSES